MQSSRSLDRLSATFDDDHAVANAGLLLSATLAQHLGLKDLFNEHVDLGSRPGRANPGDKAMTLIASLIAGGECIDDADALRAGETDQVLGHWVAAPSTLGTFLRAFSFGHARQLDKVSGELLSRAWAADAGDKELTIDLDSTICETYGLQKQGGSKFTYNHVRGYHPLVSIAARTGDVIHTRLRGGPAHAGRGGASFVTETVTRARAAGATGEIVIRADSGFYSHKVVSACRKANVRYSITVKMMGKALHQAFSDIPEDQWAPIPYFLKGAALAEITYTPFATKKSSLPVRLIVRRVPPTPGSQLALYTDYSYHAFITDRRGNMVELEADHRAHAEVENAIRDLKHGLGLNHMPSGRFGANAAWLAFNTIAHNLVRWVARIGLEESLVMTKTMRRRYFSMPGRITTSARKDTLHLPTNWPWATRFSAALVALRAISLPLRI
jgi:hypothetical protein